MMWTMTQHLPARRNFLKTAAAAVATAQFPILGANDRINVGIVGLGGRGTDHMNAYSTLDGDCKIAAVCDVNQPARERAVALIRRKKSYDPKDFEDMRKMFESKDVDAVSIATPNHWHALATIWACQAGKDVYVEKPASHNCFESVQMVAAARKYKRMVQVGSQSRSTAHKMRAIELLKAGEIGNIYHARAICFRRRFSIGHTPDEPVPAGLDWSAFLGPAPMRPFSRNRFAYTWHWFWDTGNGDIGNQGVHEIDIALWGLGRTDWPAAVTSTGGKFLWKDDQETPNTQQTTWNFGDVEMTDEARNLPTPPEAAAPTAQPNFVGNIFFGDLGFMVVTGGGFQVWKSAAGRLSGDVAHSAGQAQREKFDMTLEEKGHGDATATHMKNLFDAIRARDHKLLHADIEIGAKSAAFCHLANIAYRAGHTLQMDRKAGTFTNDAHANTMLTRKYRAPYIVPRIA